MSHSMGKKKRKGKALMLGVGLDSDGHKRLTTGPNGCIDFAALRQV